MKTNLEKLDALLSDHARQHLILHELNNSMWKDYMTHTRIEIQGKINVAREKIFILFDKESNGDQANTLNAFFNKDESK